MTKDDYLTLEQVAQRIGRPVAWLKERLCREELETRLQKGQWLVSVRYLDEEFAPVAPQQRVIHNPLADKSAKGLRASQKRTGRRHQEPSTSGDGPTNSGFRARKRNATGSRRKTSPFGNRAKGLFSERAKRAAARNYIYARLGELKQDLLRSYNADVAAEIASLKGQLRALSASKEGAVRLRPDVTKTVLEYGSSSNHSDTNRSSAIDSAPSPKRLKTKTKSPSCPGAAASRTVAQPYAIHTRNVAEQRAVGSMQTILFEGKLMLERFEREFTSVTQFAPRNIEAKRFPAITTNPSYLHCGPYGCNKVTAGG